MIVASIGVSGRRVAAVKRAVTLLVAFAGLTAAGCSADVARFDFPGLNVAQNGGTTSSLLRPSEPLRNGVGLVDTPAPSSPAPPRLSRDEVRSSDLPPPVQVAATEPVPSAQVARPVATEQAPAARGDQIEVQPGDTLFGLSKRHSVSVSELMSVNGLKGPSLKPGQKLYLPAKATAARKMVPKTPAAEMSYSPGQSAQAAPKALVAPTAQPASNWDGSYTVKPGDSLYALSRQYKVSLNELQQVNGITDPRKVKPGVVLKVPAAGGGTSTAAAPAAAPVAAPVTAGTPAQVEPITPAPRVVQSTTQPTIINGEKKVAALGDRATDASPVAAPEPKVEKVAAAGNSASSAGSASAKLRWPVKGKVITGFGPRPDGTHNDGVNISVPAGTEIHAAEAGTVAYAGSELKGYGNLVLIRHDNGWVTAYAHNDELLAKRGDRVKRGQVIAKAGTSGQVDQPQLHFELRQGSKPVDPTPFMEKM